MADKSQKSLKHTLKTNIDSAARWMALIQVGDKLEVTQDPDAAQTRKTIAENLKKLQETIRQESEEYLKLIEVEISKIS